MSVVRLNLLPGRFEDRAAEMTTDRVYYGLNRSLFYQAGLAAFDALYTQAGQSAASLLP